MLHGQTSRYLVQLASRNSKRNRTTNQMTWIVPIPLNGVLASVQVAYFASLLKVSLAQSSKESLRVCGGVGKQIPRHR